MGEIAERSTEFPIEFIEQLERENAELRKRNTQLEQSVAQLQQDLSALKELLYAKLRRGASRFDDSAPGQLFLFGELPQETNTEDSGPSTTETESGRKRDRSKPTGRQKLPPGLLRVKEIEPVDEADLWCSCCSPPQKRKLIRYEETETLEYRPAELFVRVRQREVRACPSGMEGVTTAPLPPRVIEKGRPGVSLLVFVVISKFVDHLPLHRIGKIFQREQVRIPESTLCDWVAAVADALAPIVVAMRQWMFTQPYLQADETPAKARDPAKKGKLKQIYFFACSLPWKEVVFEYSTDRKGKSLSRFLDDFKGEVIQVDEYSGYDCFFRDHVGLVRAGCWAHAIRRFKNAIQKCDRISAAREICRIIDQLAILETLMRDKGRTPEERRELRQRIHKPAIGKIRERVDEGLADPTIEPKSVYGQAIRYLHNHWDALTTFLEDGRVEMDNNGIEHSIRPLAIGRKNWMHIGHIEAGDRAAVLYSILATRVRLGINPRAYLYDVLERIPTHPIDRISELTPRNWQAAQTAKTESSG